MTSSYIPTDESIAVSAYYAWKRAGSPDGNAVMNPVNLDDDSGSRVRVADYFWSLGRMFLMEQHALDLEAGR